MYDILGNVLYKRVLIVWKTYVIPNEACTDEHCSPFFLLIDKEAVE